MGNCLTISADDGYGGARDWETHPEYGNWIQLHGMSREALREERRKE